MSKVETAGTVHFTVEGEFITRIARALWNDEDEPVKAMNLLKNLHGITEQQCLDVLAGKSKLTGDSDVGVRIEPDNAQGKSLTDIIGKLKTERDVAVDETRDLAQLANDDTVMVASPTGARKVARRKAKVGGLSTKVGIGLIDGYAFDDLIDDPERKISPTTKALRVWRQMSDEYGHTLPGKKYPSDEEEEGDEDEGVAAAHLMRQERWDAALKKAKAALRPVDTITSGLGWLSPEGKFYPCEHSQHAHVMWALGLTDNPQDHSVKPDGWIRLGMSDDRQYFFTDEAGTFTPVQKALVQARCKEQGIDEPWFLEPK